MFIPSVSCVANVQGMKCPSQARGIRGGPISIRLPPGPLKNLTSKGLHWGSIFPFLNVLVFFALKWGKPSKKHILACKQAAQHLLAARNTQNRLFSPFTFSSMLLLIYVYLERNKTCLILVPRPSEGTGSKTQ